MDLHGSISVHLTTSPTYLAADRFVLLVPIIWQCPTVKLTTIANQTFSVVGPRTWNDLPENVTSAESLSTFR